MDPNLKFTPDQQVKIEETMIVIGREPKLRKEFIEKLVRTWQKSHLLEWKTVTDAVKLQKQNLKDPVYGSDKSSETWRAAAKIPNKCISHQPACPGLMDLFEKYLPEFRIFDDKDAKELHWFMKKFPELRSSEKV